MTRNQPCGLIVQGLTEIVPAHCSQMAYRARTMRIELTMLCAQDRAASAAPHRRVDDCGLFETRAVSCGLAGAGSCGCYHSHDRRDRDHATRTHIRTMHNTTHGAHEHMIHTSTHTTTHTNTPINYYKQAHTHHTFMFTHAHYQRIAPSSMHICILHVHVGVGCGRR